MRCQEGKSAFQYLLRVNHPISDVAARKQLVADLEYLDQLASPGIDGEGIDLVLDPGELLESGLESCLARSGPEIVFVTSTDQAGYSCLN